MLNLSLTNDGNYSPSSPSMPGRSLSDWRAACRVIIYRAQSWWGRRMEAWEDGGWGKREQLSLQTKWNSPQLQRKHRREGGGWEDDEGWRWQLRWTRYLRSKTRVHLHLWGHSLTQPSLSLFKPVHTLLIVCSTACVFMLGSVVWKL